MAQFVGEKKKYSCYQQELKLSVSRVYQKSVHTRVMQRPLQGRNLEASPLSGPPLAFLLTMEVMTKDSGDDDNDGGSDRLLRFWHCF